MQIETEKTHTLILSDDELSKLRCFLDDALMEDVWKAFPDDQHFIGEIYAALYKAQTGRDL